MTFTADSTVREIIENEQARAVLEKHLPGASNHPLLPQAWYMTLREVSMYPESGLTKEKYQALLDDLAKIDE